jgi:hypothetical protein
MINVISTQYPVHIVIYGNTINEINKRAEEELTQNYINEMLPRPSSTKRSLEEIESL